ncbi:MAG: TonB-dependent receptor, partial [Gemmatimonadetes bacterium]|nr:TonB-dependent receptor [Gemmatimonadota bacterium]
MRHLFLLLVCIVLPTTVSAQATGRISGRVIDAAGAPLAGAAVSVAGQGAVTGADGGYTLSGVPVGTHTGRATRVGYAEAVQQVTVAAGQSATANFRLQAQAVALEELVFIGYGSVRRTDATGSTASIRSEAVESLPITSAEQILQGRVAGVQVVQNTGAPGGGFTVRIRGGNSMLGGNDPLYVVDGMPVTSSSILNNINPNDIQTMDVLKDASATAIYGARGANGVVLITTKKGRPGSRIEFETYAGVQEVGRIIPVMNARQYAELANEFARNEGVKQVPFTDLDNLPHDTNWQKQIFRTAPLQNYALTLSGGSAETKYLLSGNYMDQQGVIRSSDFARGTLRLNVDSDINERLRISNNLMLTRSTRHEVAEDIVHNAFVAPPTIPVYDEDGNYYDYSDYFWWGQAPRNPIADANEVLDRSTNIRILESFTAEYDLLEGMRAKTLIGANYLDSQTDYYVTRRHELGGSGGIASAGRGESAVYLNENTLSYDRAFGEDHRINTVGGFTWQRADLTRLSARASGFVNDLLQNNVLGTGESIAPPSTSRTNWTLLSWLGRANYSLRDRYLFTLSGRADGSSRFGAGNKWGFFPSAAFAWRASEEPFLANAEAISNLKLRASWGRTGNQEIGLYNSLQRIVPDLLVMGNGLVTGFAPANVANPDLRWEKTDQYNVGLDLGLWDERLTVSADAYVKNTTDLLALVVLPASSGFGSMLRNVGAVRNSGFELAVGGVPVDGESFQVTMDANIATNRNKVVAIAQDDEFMAGGVGLHGAIHLIREGEPMSVYYGFEEQGLDAQGRIRYVDHNGDGRISDLDRVILGSPYPDFTGGLNTSIRYRNLDLNASLQGSYGNEIYNSNLGYAAASFTRGENQIVDVYRNHWRPESPDPNAKYPRLSTTTLFRPSDRFIEDGSYLRLKSVRLGYRLPASERFGYEDLTVYVSGQNLLTLTGY